MAVVVTYRRSDETQVVASCPNEKEALKAAVEFLKNMNVDEDEDELDGKRRSRSGSGSLRATSSSASRKPEVRQSSVWGRVWA